MSNGFKVVLGAIVSGITLVVSNVDANAVNQNNYYDALAEEVCVALTEEVDEELSEDIEEVKNVDWSYSVEYRKIDVAVYDYSITITIEGDVVVGHSIVDIYECENIDDVYGCFGDFAYYTLNGKRVSEEFATDFINAYGIGY